MKENFSILELRDLANQVAWFMRGRGFITDEEYGIIARNPDLGFDISKAIRSAIEPETSLGVAIGQNLPVDRRTDPDSGRATDD